MSQITKESAVRFISSVPEDRRFWCNDGAVFSNLEELEEGLRSMTPETFSFHANQDKNDFSNWIYDIIGDVELADSLRETQDRGKATKKVKSRIANLKRLVK